MIELNNSFKNLNKNYLFVEIENRRKNCRRNDIINLGVGDTVRPLFRSAYFGYRQGAKGQGNVKTYKGYPPDFGYDFFIDNVVDRYSRLGVIMEAEEITVNDGAKTDLFLMMPLFKGVTALIHNPSYPAYLDQNLAFANEVRFISANRENNFLPLPDEIDDDLKGKSLLIYICSPDNPTGATYTFDDLKKWVDYAIKTQSVIVFDGAYVDYVRGNYPKSIFQIKGAENVAIEIYSLSKGANFTNLRLGFTAIKKQFMLKGVSVLNTFKRLKSIQANGVSFANQLAGAMAISEEGEKEIFKNTNYYLQNAQIIARALKGLGVFYTGGVNSPYIFASCPKGLNSFDTFDILLNDYGIVVTPGSGFNFGGENYIRLTGFTQQKSAYRSIKRLKSFYEKYG